MGHYGIQPRGPGLLQEKAQGSHSSQRPLREPHPLKAQPLLASVSSSIKRGRGQTVITSSLEHLEI